MDIRELIQQGEGQHLEFKVSFSTDNEAIETLCAFGKPYIRVGRTNQSMGPQEQKERLLAGQEDWAEEKDRPYFELVSRTVTRTEDKFQPGWNVQQVGGDHIPVIEWRFRGTRLQATYGVAPGERSNPEELHLLRHLRPLAATRPGRLGAGGPDRVRGTMARTLRPTLRGVPDRGSENA